MLEVDVDVSDSIRVLLANVKSGGTAAQDSQSEANEGACPPLPRTTCSVCIFSSSSPGGLHAFVNFGARVVILKEVPKIKKVATPHDLGQNPCALRGVDQMLTEP